jgi:hypothetical protein
MASNYTGLGVQLMTTGEKAGTWGTLTNTNWNIMEQISGGYIEQSIAGAEQTTTLSVSDGSTGAVLAHRIIKFTGSITGNQTVTIPLDVQTFYIILNGTTDGSGTPTVNFKYVSGSGSSITWAASDKGTKLVYATADDGTNPNIVDVGFGTGDVTLTGTQTLTNKTLTSPAIGTSILDTAGLELINLTATGSAVNEFTIANAATTAGPTLSATGETNVDINITPKGSGKIALDGIKWPNADGSADQIMTTDGSGVLSFVDNSGGTSWQAVHTSATLTAVAGNGYFIDTTSNVCNVTLPAGTLGDEVTLVDYAATFDSNNLTVTPDSGEKIQGQSADATLTCAVERAGFTLAYSGATQGWLLKDK